MNILKDKTSVFKLLTIAEGVLIVGLVIAVIILAGRGSDKKQPAQNDSSQIQTEADSKDLEKQTAADNKDLDKPSDNADTDIEATAQDDGTYKPNDRWENYSKTYLDWTKETSNALCNLNKYDFKLIYNYSTKSNPPYLDYRYFYDKIVENEENCLHFICLQDNGDYYILNFRLDNNRNNDAYMDTDILTSVIDSLSIVVDDNIVLDKKAVGEISTYEQSCFKFTVAVNKQGLAATSNMKLVFTNNSSGMGVDKVIDLIADSYLIAHNRNSDTNAVVHAFFDKHPDEFPQIDSSTARKPITEAIFKDFISQGNETVAEEYADLFPWCNKTHGAWLNLADRKADLVFLVMPTEEEKQYLAERNVPVEIKPYGADGLAIILNPNAPVKSFTVDQIRQIYEGKITNWKQLGGEDHPINPLYRNEQSGSQRMFEEFLWPDGDVPDFSAFNTIDSVIGSFEEYDDMGSITIQVFNDPYAIGYNIVSYIYNEFDYGYVDMAEVDGVYPCTDTFTDGSYPFTTTAYVAIRADEPELSPARRLFEWLNTNEFNDICRYSSSLSVFTWKPCTVYDYANLTTDVYDIIERIYYGEVVTDRCNLKAVSDEDLAILRNTVYALHGKKFSKQEYTDFFSQYYWYSPNNSGLSDDEITELFTQTEKQNLSLIIAEEKRRKNQ